MSCSCISDGENEGRTKGESRPFASHSAKVKDLGSNTQVPEVPCA